jgi:hypothetical protein
MLGLIIPFIIGALVGIPLTFYCLRFHHRSVAYRLGVGLLAGIGIGVTINATVELLDLAGFWPTHPQEGVSSMDETTGAVGSKPVDASAGEANEPSSWEQDGHTFDPPRTEVVEHFVERSVVHRAAEKPPSWYRFGRRTPG